MTELTRAEVVLGGNDTQLQNTLARAQRSMDRVGRKMGRMGRTLTARVTAPLAAIGGASVKAFSDFDQAMTESLAIMGDVSDTMRTEMADAAREVSQITTASSKEAAEAFFFLASAGLDAEQSVAALPQVARFAQAGMFDLSTATDLATDAQSALGLASEDAQENLQNMTRVTDTLVGANTLANASVQQFATALTTQAGAAMKTFGVDVEEGTAVLAAFADQGIKGERAGTGFSRMLRLMSQAAVNNKEEMEKLGISFFNAQGELRPLADIIQNLTDRLSGMSDEQRSAALDAIGFSARVQQVIQPLLGTSDAIREYERSLRGMAGVTAEVSDKQMESFSAQLKLIRNNLQNAAIVIGETLAPMVTSIAQKIGELATKFSELDSRTQKLIIAFGGLAAAIGPVLIVMGSLVRSVAVLTGLKIVSAVGGWATAFASLAVQVRTLAGAFALLQVAMGPAGWVILGVSAGVAALATFTDVFDDLGRAIADVAGTIRDEFNRDMRAMRVIGEKIGDVLGPMFAALGRAAEVLAEKLGFIVVPLRELKNLLAQIDISEFLLMLSGPGIKGLVDARREWERFRDEVLLAEEAVQGADLVPRRIVGPGDLSRQIEAPEISVGGGAGEAAEDTRELGMAASGASTSVEGLGTAMAFAGDMGSIFRNLLPEMGTGLRQMAEASRESARRMADLTQQMERVRAENQRIKERARQKVDELVSQVRLSKIQEEMRMLNDMADRMARGFVDAFEAIGKGSKSVVEAITDMVANILIQMARLQAQKMFASFFSGLLGGGIPDAPGPITGVEPPSIMPAEGSLPGVDLEIPGLQHGGQFTVGGSGGADSQLVRFAATPGEVVTVQPKGKPSGGGGMGGTVNVNVNVKTFDSKDFSRGMLETGLLQQSVKEAVRQSVDAPTKSDAVRRQMVSGRG